MSSKNVELVRSYFGAANGKGVDGLIRRVRVGGFRTIGDYSGIELAAQGATVWRFENGNPISMRYQNKADAL